MAYIQMDRSKTDKQRCFRAAPSKVPIENKFQSAPKESQREAKGKLKGKLKGKPTGKPKES